MIDRIISNYESVEFDNNLRYCPNNGIVYQDDTSLSVAYDIEYFNSYVKREGTDIANKLNEWRTSVTEKYCKHSLLDVGIGSGEFMRKSKIKKAFGFDINEVAVSLLKEQGLFLDPYMDDLSKVEGISMWDVLEHLPSPTEFLDLLNQGHYIFVSIPVFNDLIKLQDSKHFKRNEHYLYFTKDGLVNYFNDAGFRLLETSDAETIAGRDNIWSFVFIKDN